MNHFILGIFDIKVNKEIVGQHFDGLEMITKLLAPVSTSLKPPLIEVIGKTPFFIRMAVMCVIMADKEGKN